MLTGANEAGVSCSPLGVEWVIRGVISSVGMDECGEKRSRSRDIVLASGLTTVTLPARLQ